MFSYFTHYSSRLGVTSLCVLIALIQDINMLFQNRRSVHLVLWLADNSQHHGTIEQIAARQGTDLTLVKNADNSLTLKFIPGVTTGVQNRMRINGNDNSFTNCDTNPSSYIMFQRATTDIMANGMIWPNYEFNRRILNMMLPLSAHPVPADYRMYATIAFGGCGTVSGTKSGSTVIGMALGFS